MPNTINWSKLIKHIKVNNTSPSFISKEKLQSLPEKVMKLSFGTVSFLTSLESLSQLMETVYGSLRTDFSQKNKITKLLVI